MLSYAHTEECAADVSMDPDFTHDELRRFETAFEEGYDVVTNERYNLWLKLNHPDQARELHVEDGTNPDDLKICTAVPQTTGRLSVLTVDIWMDHLVYM